MNHTPGPWEVLGPFPSIHVGVMVDASCGGPEPPVYDSLCQVYYDPKYEKEASAETKANAYLIAAAPDLLDACKAVCQAASECASDERFGEAVSELLQQIRAAIDKAKGLPKP